MELKNAAQAKKIAETLVKQAMRGQVSQQLDDFVDEVFKKDVWDWNDNTTNRRNGYETVTSPRNIYDLGNLYESEELFDYSVGTQVFHSREWEAFNEKGDDYAVFVHDGTKNHPARPWTDRIKEEHEDELAQILGEAIAAGFSAL